MPHPRRGDAWSNPIRTHLQTILSDLIEPVDTFAGPGGRRTRNAEAWHQRSLSDTMI